MNPRPTVNVLLFHTSSGKPFPIMETLPPQQRDPRRVRSDRWSRLKWKVDRAYQTIEERLDYHEKLCSDLRHVHHLNVYHAAGLDREGAERQFTGFLKERYSRHRRWLWIDGVLAALGSLLVPLPGPNIFFFYPAARTLGHNRAMKGAKQILSGNSFSLHNEGLIDQVQQRLNDLESVRPAVATLQARYNVSTLETQLARVPKKS